MCTVDCIKSSIGIGTHITLVLVISLIFVVLFPITANMPQVREYYIAADQVLWDYLPGGINQATGSSTLPAAGQFYFEQGPDKDRIGSQYHKARYRRYNDKTFETPVNEDPSLGILGPTLYVQVGDTLKIHFKNNLPYPTNIQPHGIAVANKDVWDSDVDGSRSVQVQPGEVTVYEWEVTEEAGPQGEYDGCVSWLYYPGGNATANWQSGLVGMIVVTALNSRGLPMDIDVSYPLFFSIFDENLSPFIDVSGEDALGVLWNPALKNNSDFRESNRMAAINGYAYGNLQLSAKKDDSAQFYLGTLAEGAFIEKMAVHFHSLPISLLGHRVSAVALVPSSVWVVNSKATKAREWIFRTMTDSLTDRGLFGFIQVEN